LWGLSMLLPGLGAVPGAAPINGHVHVVCATSSVLEPGGPQAEELTPRVRHHFISFLNCIASGEYIGI
jgi:hypothetical protein